MNCKKIDTDDDVMTLEEWRACCDCGGFIDYDGFGYYSDGKVMWTDHTAHPSERNLVKPPEGTTHVVWFNR